MPKKPFRLSVKVVISDGNRRCLLLRRSAASKNNAGEWELPGGKIDPGESFDRALLREVFEETGLSVALKGLAGSTEAEALDATIVYLIMEGLVESGELRLSSEHDQFRWVDLKDLAGIDIAPQFQDFAGTYGRNHQEP